MVGSGIDDDAGASALASLVHEVIRMRYLGSADDAKDRSLCRFSLPDLAAALGWRRSDAACQVAEKRSVVVVGGGVMGLSTSRALANVKSGRCASVTLIDAGHANRSSWGDARNTQLGGISQEYAAMVRYSWDVYKRYGALWPTNALRILPKKDEAIKAAFERAGATCAWVSPADIRAMYDGRVNVKEGEFCLWSNRSAVIHASKVLEKLREDIEGRVTIVEDDVVEIDRAKKIVTTSNGTTVSYDDLIITAGPWTNSVLACAGLRILPIAASNEQKIHYMPEKDEKEHYSIGNIPTILRVYRSKHAPSHIINCYSLPIIPHQTGGFIASAHGEGNFLNRKGEFLVPEDAMKRVLEGKSRFGLLSHHKPGKVFWKHRSGSMDKWGEALTDEYVEQTLPRASVGPSSHFLIKRCLYTMNLVDSDFVVGRHPDDASVLCATGFNGEGFKFAPGVGLMLCRIIFPSLCAGDDDPAALPHHDSMVRKFDPARLFDADHIAKSAESWRSDGMR